MRKTFQPLETAPAAHKERKAADLYYYLLYYTPYTNSMLHKVY